VYLFQWLVSVVEEVFELALLMGVQEVLAVLEEEEPSFFPFKPHRLLMLRLIGFLSFLSCPPFPSAAIFASISAFFFKISEACADMATSLLAFPSPGLKVLLHILATFAILL